MSSAARRTPRVHLQRLSCSWRLELERSFHSQSLVVHKKSTLCRLWLFFLRSKKTKGLIYPSRVGDAFFILTAAKSTPLLTLMSTQNATEKKYAKNESLRLPLYKLSLSCATLHGYGRRSVVSRHHRRRMVIVRRRWLPLIIWESNVWSNGWWWMVMVSSPWNMKVNFYRLSMIISSHWVKDSYPKYQPEIALRRFVACICMYFLALSPVLSIWQFQMESCLITASTTSRRHRWTNMMIYQNERGNTIPLLQDVLFLCKISHYHTSSTLK